MAEPNAEERAFAQKSLREGCGGELVCALWVNKVKGKGTQRRLAVVGTLAVCSIKKGLKGKSVGTLCGVAALESLSLTSAGSVYHLGLTFFNGSETTYAGERTALEAIGNAALRVRSRLTCGWPKSCDLALLGLAPKYLTVEPASQGLPPGGCLAQTYQSFCASESKMFNKDFLDFLNKASSGDGSDAQCLNLSLSPAFDSGKANMWPVCMALRANGWYDKLVVTESPRPEVVASMAAVLQCNVTLREVTFSSCGSRDGFTELANSLASNKLSSLTELDLSGNPINPEHFLPLARGIRMVAGLECLNLSDCGLSQGFLKALCLGNTGGSIDQLVVLSLGGNPFGHGGTGILVSWLNRPGVAGLETLDVPGCDFNISELTRGGFSGVTSLDIGRSTLTKGAIKAITRGISNSPVLREISIAAPLQLDDPHGSVTSIIKAMSGRGDASFNLGSIVLGMPFATELHTAQSLAGLCLDDATIDIGTLTNMLGALEGGARQLRALSLSRVINAKDREESRKKAMEALASVIRTCSKLEAVVMVGSAERHAGPPMACVLQAIGESGSLLDVNFSGNRFGDEGMIALASALVVTRSLEGCGVDEAHVTMRGFAALHAAVVANTTLIRFLLPVMDVQRVKSKLKKSEGQVLMQLSADILKHVAVQARVRAAEEQMKREEMKKEEEQKALLVNPRTISAATPDRVQRRRKTPGAPTGSNPPLPHLAPNRFGGGKERARAGSTCPAFKGGAAISFGGRRGTARFTMFGGKTADEISQLLDDMSTEENTLGSMDAASIAAAAATPVGARACVLGAPAFPKIVESEAEDNEATGAAGMSASAPPDDSSPPDALPADPPAPDTQANSSDTLQEPVAAAPPTAGAAVAVAPVRSSPKGERGHGAVPCRAAPVLLVDAGGVPVPRRRAPLLYPAR